MVLRVELSWFALLGVELSWFTLFRMELSWFALRLLLVDLPQASPRGAELVRQVQFVDLSWFALLLVHLSWLTLLLVDLSPSRCGSELVRPQACVLLFFLVFLPLQTTS